MSLVVDASVASKWILPEPGSDDAAALRDRADVLIAPSLIVAEIGNAIWKRARAGEVSAWDAIETLATAVGLIDVLVPIEEFGSRAMTISLQLKHPIYDCFYLALAERERLPLVTADGRMQTAATTLGTIEVLPL